MSKLKVLLINPPVLKVQEPWYDTPDFVRVSIAYLAGYLRQFEGYEIRLIDAKFERLNFQQVLEQTLAFEPDIVGLTAFTNEIKPAAYQAALIKQQKQDTLTIIGGVHLTSIPKQTLEEFKSFDVGVVGEGEITFKELCENVKNNVSIKDIKGIVYREKEQIILNPPRSRILDQDSIPFPAWDMLPPAKTYFIQSQRGCPYNCLFCMNPNGKAARIRSVDNVIEELNLLVNTYQPKRITFGDELFSVNMQRTHQLMDEMIKHDIGLKTSWDVQTHVNFVDEELFNKFKAANVERVELGIETGDEEIMRKMGKGTSMEKIKKAHEAARKAGVPIGTFFLFGQPNETEASIKKTIDLAVKINPVLPMFGLMTPYPGTEVAKLAAKGEAGYQLISTDWDEYNKQIGGAMTFSNLTRSQIERLQILAYTKVFLYNHRYTDFLKFLWEYRVGALEVAKKLLSGRKDNASGLNKPKDYDQLLKSDFKITAEDIIDARKEWNETQKRELVYFKKNT